METFVLLIGFGIATSFIARGKGRAALPWFFVGFFLALIGLIIAIVVKPKQVAASGASLGLGGESSMKQPNPSEISRRYEDGSQDDKSWS